MIERQPIGDAAAAIMPGERKTHMAERFHRLHYGLRHRPLGIGRVIAVALRHVGPAIARQIGDDQGEAVSQLRRDAMPHHMGFRKPMQQQQRWSFATDAGEDTPGRGVDPFRRIAGKQVGEIGHVHTLTLSSANADGPINTNISVDNSRRGVLDTRKRGVGKKHSFAISPRVSREL
jgi:hypothetical protein